MYIRQLYTNCLSEAAYYIESNGEAAVIDPLRDIEEYLRIAEERNAKIKFIFETHFHADFVSGHIDLGKATGAPIIYGPGTSTSYPVYVAEDGETFQLGGLTIEVLHTPGHTLESSCYLLKDENGKNHCVFSGDTLFVGDVGRPDLSQKGSSITKNDLAGMLYDSIQAKIMPLADDVILYPAHGPGSSCGKNLGPDTQSTIGKEKETNYALKAESRDAFIAAVTEGLLQPPQYFPVNARINKEGYTALDELLDKAVKPLSIEAFKKLRDDGATILDTRNATLFTKGFVPGSISIGLEGRFAEWAGTLLSFEEPLILVTDAGKERESMVRLARVGFQNMQGYLEGGFEAWKNSGESIDMIIDVEPDEMLMDLPFDERMVVIDVRKQSEFDQGHVDDALNMPLHELTDPGQMGDFEEDHNLYIHCQGGYRSVIAASLFKKQGIHNLRNVLGGWKAIEKLRVKS